MTRAWKLFLALLAALLVVSTTSLAAAVGTWGADGAPYLDGEICPQGAGTAPLAAWDFGTGSRAFLLSPVTSTGGVDSAALPYLSNGTPQLTNVGPGLDGFSSAADISAYAYLISHYGSDTSDHVAEVAAAIMTKAGASGVPSCANAVDQASILANSALYAGPYTVTLAAPAKPVIIGSPTVLTASVRSASGHLVPGLAISFSAPGASLNPASSTTDANGQAQTVVTIAAGSTPSITAQATVSAPIGLVQLLDPKGGGVPTVGAIYTAAPVSASGTVTLTNDPSAAPVLHAKVSDGVLALGQAFQESVDITGLRGHSGGVQFKIYGPLGLAPDGSCSAAAFTAATPVAATTDAVTAHGDGSVAATAWTPSKAGCYAVQATIATTDATPNVTASSALTASTATVAVLATSAALSVGYPVLGVGAIHADVTVNGTFGGRTTVAATALGPVAPVANSCAQADFSHAPTAAKFASVAGVGDGTVAISSTPTTAAGCYRLQSAVVVSMGDRGTLELPVSAANVLVIAPQVSTTVSQVWDISPAPIKAQVDVHSLYGQSAHVSLQLAYASSPTTGCTTVDWSAKPLVSEGKAITAHGDSTGLAVSAAVTKELGCYLPVARLVVDANPSIVVTAPLSNDNNAIIAGVDGGAGHPLIGSPTHMSQPLLPYWLASGLAIVLMLGAVAATIRLALLLRAARNRRSRQPAQP